jgi:hypothetical protein
MVDPQQVPSGTRPGSEVCDEIGRAVASLWQRRSGARPSSVTTEYVGDVVRCTIEEEQDPVASDDAPVPHPDELDSRRYGSRATAAVARLTGRRVVGFVAKDAADDATTNTFILDSRRIKH